MTSTAMDAARVHYENELREWATSHFPDIDDLTWRETNEGDAVTGSAFLGTWHGVTLRISRFRPTWTLAHVQVLCGTCGRYSTPRGFGHGLASATDVVVHYAGRDLPTTVEECFACRWLLGAQAVARTRKSRFGRWLFKQAYGLAVDEVLARTP